MKLLKQQKAIPTLRTNIFYVVSNSVIDKDIRLNCQTANTTTEQVRDS